MNLFEGEHKELDFLGYGMDKDDALDFLLPYQLIERKEKDNTVTVVVGADDPEDLLSDGSFDFAIEKAEFILNGPAILLNKTEVMVNGQNELPRVTYVFQKKV